MLGLHRPVATVPKNPYGHHGLGRMTTCIGWWDFTDWSSLYTDAGSTNVTAEDQKIYRVENKAYRNFGSNKTGGAGNVPANPQQWCLGAYCDQSTEANRPLVKEVGKINSAYFDGVNDILSATASVGNVLTNYVKKDGRIAWDNMLMAVVSKSENTSTGDNANAAFNIGGQWLFSGLGTYDIHFAHFYYEPGSDELLTFGQRLILGGGAWSSIVGSSVATTDNNNLASNILHGGTANFPMGVAKTNMYKNGKLRNTHDSFLSNTYSVKFTSGQTQQVDIGGATDHSSNRFKGDIFEIIVLGLSNDDRGGTHTAPLVTKNDYIRVQRYLHHKYKKNYGNT